MVMEGAQVEGCRLAELVRYVSRHEGVIRIQLRGSWNTYLDF